MVRKRTLKKFKDHLLKSLLANEIFKIMPFELQCIPILK